MISVKRLTPIQSAVLFYVRAFELSHGRRPGLRPIAKRFGWESLNAARCHLRALRKKGLLK